MKTVMITGATDGIGLVTAQRLLELGHKVVLHGRNAHKLDAVQQSLRDQTGSELTETLVADLSRLDEVESLADQVLQRSGGLDVLINNAGVLRVPQATTPQGLDVRFVVNTIAPYHLTRRLWQLLGSEGRVVNLSSAAQASVQIRAVQGELTLDAMQAYAQSKLALTQWSFELAGQEQAPIILAVNPGSLLASKMVKEGFGVSGKDLDIGARILCSAALDAEFATHSGEYFDNDAGRFAPAHADATNQALRAELISTMDALLAQSISP